MSYDIIYNKQFVQLRRTGEVIPMVLVGPSNCYEAGDGRKLGRRTRSWDSMDYYNRKGKVSEKPAVLLKNLDADLRAQIRRRRDDPEASPAHIRQHFGYYIAITVGGGRCFDTSWDRYRGLFVNGIKKAMTLEQLAALGIYLEFHSFTENPDGKPAETPIRNETEYFAELKKWREWQSSTGGHPYLRFVPLSTDAVVERLRSSRRKVPKPKVPVTQDHYFVLSDGTISLLRYTRSGYRYSYHKSGGKRFRTEADAERYRKQLVEGERYKAETWHVERINQTAVFAS